MNNRISKRNKKKLLVDQPETKEDMIRGVLEA